MMETPSHDSAAAAPVASTIETPAPKPVVEPLSLALRLKLLLTGAVGPLLCLGCVTLFGASGSLDEPWQSGRWEHYIALLLRWPAIGPFLPSILFSIASLTYLVWRPDAVRHFAIRWGIYAGVPMALLFFLLIFATSGPATLIAAGFVGPTIWAVGFAAEWLFARRRQFKIRDLLILTFVCALGAAFLRFAEVRDVAEGVFRAPLILLIGATPTLNLVTYLRLAVWAWRQTRENSPRATTVGWIAWLVTFAASLKFAVDRMLEEYAKLPTTDPNCYVSTAATSGHRWLVGDRPGVSLQTRRLKFLEFVLRAAAPGFHRALRRHYDHLGPPLARWCRRNPWFADATYLFLKPLEWTAELLRGALRISSWRVRSLYARTRNG